MDVSSNLKLVLMKICFVFAFMHGDKHLKNLKVKSQIASGINCMKILLLWVAS